MRTATSRRRVTARARSRLATFAQAISSTSATAPLSTTSIGRASRAEAGTIAERHDRDAEIAVRVRIRRRQPAADHVERRGRVRDAIASRRRRPSCVQPSHVATPAAASCPRVGGGAPAEGGRTSSCSAIGTHASGGFAEIETGESRRRDADDHVRVAVQHRSSGRRCAASPPNRCCHSRCDSTTTRAGEPTRSSSALNRAAPHRTHPEHVEVVAAHDLAAGFASVRPCASSDRVMLASSETVQHAAMKGAVAQVGIVGIRPRSQLIAARFAVARALQTV